MRRRLDPSQRRDELIEFGCRHFAEFGYDQLSVDDIAQLAGVSKGTIYNYFGGRHGFYLATITAVVEELLAEIEPEPGVPIAQMLPTLTRSFVRYAEANAGIYVALVRGGLGADDAVGALLERVRVTAAAHVVAALGAEPSPRLRLAIGGWVAFVEATTASWLEGRTVDEDELVELFIQNLLSLIEVAS